MSTPDNAVSPVSWVCEDCGWPWPPYSQPDLDSECDNCGGPLVRERTIELSARDRRANGGDVRAVDIPGVGKVVVLAPMPYHPDHGFVVGDTVDVEEECPMCDGMGIVWNDMGYRCTCGTGTVSVPRVVTEVLPMFAASHPCGNGAPHLYLRRGEWRRCDGRGVGSTHVGAIPGAVERKP